jgi:hypothetical protein
MGDVANQVSRDRRLKLTTYRIQRDHDNRTELFRVSVPEAKQRGFGAQVRFGRWICGISLILIGCGSVTPSETTADGAAGREASAAAGASGAAGSIGGASGSGGAPAIVDAGAELGPEAPPRVCSAINYQQICISYLSGPQPWVCVAGCRNTAGVSAWPVGPGEACAAELESNELMVCVQNCNFCPTSPP